MGRRQAIVVGLLAGLGVLLAGCPTPGKRPPREITVLGVAEVMVPPDYVTVRATVVTLDMDVEKAQAENDRKVKAVLDFVRNRGITPRDIRTEYTSLNRKERRRRDEPPVFEGYEASNAITIHLRDIAKYDELVAGMIKLGTNRLGGISFESTQEIEKRREARLLAIKAAREKAEYLAAALGQEVGRPVWISEFRRDRSDWRTPSWSNVAYVAPSATAEADTQQGTIAPGSKTIRAQVEVCFSLVN